MLTYNRDTPLLFILANYTENTVFEKIRNKKPQKLYIASLVSYDLESLEGQLKAEEIIAKIDWECKVKTIYLTCNPEINGIIEQAVSWFFENEENGIVLEGKVVPQGSFFAFCSELLERYKDNDRISMISGGFYKNRYAVQQDDDYYFSILAETHGWAGWRRSWDLVKGNRIKINDILCANDIYEKNVILQPFKAQWHKLLNGPSYATALNEIGLKFMLQNVINGTLTIVPNQNLMHFIHSPDDRLKEVKEIEINEINHPEFITCNAIKDIEYQELKFHIPAITKNEPDGYSFLQKKLSDHLNDSASVSERMKIPKIVHQIYEDPAGPSDMLLTIAESWKEKNTDWEYRFWGKKEMEDFLETYFPDFIPIYKSYPFNVQRWDAIRYLILYRIGGLYVDFDYECVESLDVLVCDSTCCMGLEPTLNAKIHNKNLIVGNAFMASAPGHRYFEAIIKDMFENRTKVYSTHDALQIVETTGPFLTTRAYEQLTDKEKETVTLLSADLVAPLTIEEARMLFNDETTPEIEAKIEKSYAIHYFLGSWVEQTSKNKESKKVSEKLKI